MALTIRRARREDASAASDLLAKQCADFFPGEVHTEKYVERAKIETRLSKHILLKSLLSMAVEDSSGELVAFACFNDLPPFLFDSTESYLASAEERSEQLAGASARNSLFLTAWGARDSVAQEAFQFTMQTLFATLPHVDFVLSFSSPSSSLRFFFQENGFSENGTFRFTAQSDDKALNESKEECKQDGDSVLLKGWVAERVYFRPSLTARQAQVEDYDDLVQIFDRQSELVSKVYGEFFLAELIECQDENNKAFVADLDGKAVGLLSISSEVDVQLLQEAFQLEPYDNLEKVKALGLDESKYEEGKTSENSNVFAITLFGIDEAHKSRARDLLEAVFECFPDKEYCALTLPNDAYETALLPYFFSVPIREGSSMSHALYLIHKDSIRAIKSSYMLPDTSGDEQGEEKTVASSGKVPDWVGGSQLTLSRLTKADLYDVRDLVHGLENGDEVEETARASLDVGNDLESLVVKVFDQVVGVLIFELHKDEEEHTRNIHRLDQLFDLRGVSGLPHEGPTWCEMRHGRLLHVIMVPIFNQFSRSLFRDAMRFLRIDVVHYQLFPGMKPPASVVEEMPQVRPRRIAHLHRLHRKRHLDEPRDKKSRFALFTITKTMLSEPRLVVNTRVVVVGGSETGLSILEELLLVPHCHFPKLILITPGGLADERFNGVRNFCTQGSAAPGSFDSCYLDRLGMRERITVVEDRMVYLEREAQAVVLSDDSLVEYDYLVLATGLQDTALQTECGIKQEDLKECKPLADSVYVVSGDPIAAATIRRMVELKHSASRERAIVYGNSIEAFSTVQALLSLGKAGKYISIVHPDAEEDWSKCFGSDSWTAEAVKRKLEEENVTILPNLRLSGIERVNENGRISKAVFLRTDATSNANELASKMNGGVVTATGQSRKVQNDIVASSASTLTGHVKSRLGDAKSSTKQGGGTLFHEIQCGLLVCAGPKNIDQDIFASINDTGLVYDGRLVVDAEFRTVDARIFGAGTNTKFSRRYRVKHTIENFNSREVGAAVASSLLRCIDPVYPGTEIEDVNSEQSAQELKREKRKPPTFSLPKFSAYSVDLPGSLRYFRACRPGWDEQTQSSKVLETRSDYSFCKIHLDTFDHVAAISYGVSDEYFASRFSKTVTKTDKPLSEDARAELEGKAGDISHAEEEGGDDEQKTSELDKPAGWSTKVASWKNRIAPLDQLVGIHVSYLNDIEKQLESGEIQDLLEFLSRDWAGALYLDGFRDFCRVLQSELASSSDAASLEEALQTLKEMYKSGENESFERIIKRNEHVGPCGNQLKGSSKSSIQTRLAHFLKEHSNVLEMYYLGNHNQ